MKAGFAQTPIVISANKGSDSSWMGEEVPSLKMSRKKFTLKRRLIQNMVTRFNSYYNARTKLEEAVENAKTSHADNYDTVLSLFPYSAKDFIPQTGDLDSALFDASYGIEIHDPRSKWIDNLYLIAGKAYFFKQDYLNAITAFKFIIKHGGAKDEEGRPAVIGSVGYTPRKDVSVVTPEQKKLFYHTPSRNDAFIWLIRSYIDSGEYTLAGNLIHTLKNDPVFPERLQSSLSAVESSFYFKQQSWAKGMAALEIAANTEKDKTLKARWNYILGQFYQNKENWEAALNHYNQVINLPAGPLMHFYAYLNQSEIHILKNKQGFDLSSQPLIKMARKEKYASYRSIIYYRIAQMALKSDHPDKAIVFLKSSLLNNPENVAQKLQSAHLLADIYYEQGQYRPARNYYDTAASLISSGVPGNSIIHTREVALGGIVRQSDIIDRQDSLQHLASMPAADLEAFLKEIVKDSLRARRKRNLFLPEATSAGSSAGMTQPEGTASASNQSGGGNQAVWYFYNAPLKAKGFSIFQSEWGKRPLTDNWRMSGSSQQGLLASANSNGNKQQDSVIKNHLGEDENKDIQALMANIPLQRDQKKKSNDSVIQALYAEAAIFDEELNNDTAAAHRLAEISKRYPDHPPSAETYYRSYLIQIHGGNTSEAEQYRRLILQKFPDSKYAADFSNAHAQEISPAPRVTTQIYDSAYLNYLSGNYEKVLALKDSAERTDPHNAQKSRFDLLGAMAIIKQQKDSAGKVALKEVMSQDKNDIAIVAQAAAILNALNHKQELIEHLAHLQLPEEQPQEEKASYAFHEEKPAGRDTLLSREPHKAVSSVPAETKPRKDTARQAAPAPPPPPPVTPYKINAASPQFVVLAFNRTEKTLIDESLHNFSAYNEKEHTRDSIEVSTYLLANNRVILIFRLFPNETAALKYYQEIKEKATTIIIPDIPQDYYRIFIISRNNFILLNNTKDYNGYLKFFSENYR